jgi:hypothetical protein
MYNAVAGAALLAATAYHKPLKGESSMDLILSIIGILVVVAIAFVIARFLLKLTGRVIGCVLTVIVALGIAFILIVFVF